MQEKHRRAQIIDTLTREFANHLLKNTPDFVDPGGRGRSYRTWFAEVHGYTDFFDDPDPAFPSHVVTVQKRYLHWTTLDEQGAIPALLLSYADPGNELSQQQGGPQAEFAPSGYTEEYLPIQVVAVLKEQPNSPDLQLRKAMTDQAADMIFSLEKIVNGMLDMGVTGVQKVQLAGLPRTSEGRITASAGTPLEVLIFKVIVTHVYSASSSV